GVALPVVEDARLDVERLGGYPQALRDLLHDVGARAPQSALDLAQVRIGDACGLGELANRDLRLLTLLTDVGPDAANCDRTHAPSVSSPASSACNCKSSC